MIRPGVEFAELTDVGCQREQNEDFSGYWEAPSEDAFQRQGRLLLVADGMGGYEGGQEASRIAVKTVREVYENAGGEDPQRALITGLETAHRRIQEYARAHPSLFGMGTTCTAASLVDGRLRFAHVGDSRLYLVRGDSIGRLTRDHSYVNHLVESGIIAAGEAEAHPQRHILTAALGVGSELTPDFPPEPLPLLDGDVLVLCTDGLWGLVSEEEIRQVVRTKSPTDASRELVTLARERGGPDNITVQLARIAGNAGGKPKQARSNPAC